MKFKALGPALLVMTFFTVLILLLASGGLILARGEDDSGPDDSAGQSQNSSSGSPSGSSGSADDNSSSSSGSSENEIRREPELRREPEIRGGEFELRGRENEAEDMSEVRHMGFHIINGVLQVETEDFSGNKISTNQNQGVTVNLSGNGKEEKIEVEAEDDHFRIRSNDQTASLNFPLLVDQENGLIFVETGQGLKEIRVLPDQAAQIARERGIISRVENMEFELEDQAGEEGNLVIVVKGHKEGSILSIIPVSESVQVLIGSMNGEILKVNQPWWVNILSSLIR